MEFNRKEGGKKAGRGDGTKEGTKPRRYVTVKHVVELRQTKHCGFSVTVMKIYLWSHFPLKYTSFYNHMRK